jgi:N-acyl-D-amino-acid deacylase
LEVSSGLSDPFDTVFDLIIKNKGNIQIAYFYQNKEDMMNILKNPEAMVGADADHDIDYFDSEKVGGCHPRGISTFTKFLRLIREEKIMPIEDAVRRITYLPAETARLDHIGLLLEGYHADVCIFDWKSISETNDYAHPYRKNKGIDYVIVNGNVVVEKGRFNGLKAGKFLKKRD